MVQPTCGNIPGRPLRVMTALPWLVVDRCAPGSCRQDHLPPRPWLSRVGTWRLCWQRARSGWRALTAFAALGLDMGDLPDFCSVSSYGYVNGSVLETIRVIAKTRETLTATFAYGIVLNMNSLRRNQREI
jgi:hypothetical protein